MNKPSSVNYPDILGSITGGPRKNIEVVQCALSSRPDRNPAGKTFEAILLIQSAVDAEVDVRVELELPQVDANRRKGMFFCKTAKLLVGLQPAEVGYVTLPISSSPNTAPADNYMLTVNIEVKLLSKQMNQIRAPNGGGIFTKAVLSDKVQADIESLQRLTFSANGSKKRNQLVATFASLPPGGIASLRQLSPGWVSLWTMQDYLDDTVILKRIQQELDILLPQLNRQVIFKPLMQTVQDYFKSAGYPIDVAEAIYICKILMLVVEQTAQQAATLPQDKLPTWYLQMARTLFQEKRFAQQPVYLVTKQLFPAILRDTILHAFSMTTTVTGKHLGTQDEIKIYADSIVNSLVGGGEPLNFARTYLPLITGGIIANARVTMPREQLRDTLFMISKSIQRRLSERDENNGFLFSMLESLIDRGTEQFE
jgi:hypothetical protein